MFNYKVAYSYQAMGMTYKVCRRFSLPFLPCCRHLQILLLHAQYFKYSFPLLISIFFFSFLLIAKCETTVSQVCLEGLISLSGAINNGTKPH